MSYERPSIPEAMMFLGTTAHEVAASLRALNLKGSPVFPSYCILAQYLRKLGYSKVKVGAYDVYLDGVKAYELPDYLYEFRNRFDQGFYPYLLEW